MRTITKTHTGAIISDTDLKLEYLYVGDYGKENNIKADFLGYTKRIEEVKHQPVHLDDKLVVTISSQKGCCMKCNFCDCPRYGFHGNATRAEMISEAATAIALSGVRCGERLNVHFARMGEPTWNKDVPAAAATLYDMYHGMFREYHPVVSTMMPRHNENLEDFLLEWIAMGQMYGGADGFGLQFSINTLDDAARDEMFGDKSLPLYTIGKIIDGLPTPGRRKYTLNFAVTSESNLDPALMDRYFDKDKCIVKMTPIHATKRAIANGYEIVKDFDVYEKFEKPLVATGWDVIVFVPSAEEDADRITCGNALLATEGRG